MSTVFQTFANRRRHRSQEHKDVQARKVRLGDIERLRRTMQTVPEHQTEEATMAEAVRMFAPEIEPMKAKGYGGSPIAAHLSDNGLALTADPQGLPGRGQGRRSTEEAMQYQGSPTCDRSGGDNSDDESKAGVVARGALAGAEHPARVDTKTPPRVTAPSTASATPATPKRDDRNSDPVTRPPCGGRPRADGGHPRHLRCPGRRPRFFRL